MSKALIASVVLLIIFGLTRIEKKEPESEIHELISNPAEDSLIKFIEQFEAKLIQGAKNKKLPGGAFCNHI